MHLTRFTKRKLGITLIELVFVISIIAILAAMIFPAIKVVKRRILITRARGELGQMQSYIDSYKTKLGFYPPDNRHPQTGQLLAGLNQLYYELAGTAFTNGNAFVPIDHTAPPLTTTMILAFFGPGVSGFVNSDRGDGEEGRVAMKFLKGTLKPGQLADTSLTNPAIRLSVTGRILVCTVPGPDPNNPPLNHGSPALNPWCYNSSAPTNNTLGYDLWADIYIDGKTNRICNWSSQPLIVY